MSSFNSEDSLYAILGVSEVASQSDLKKAYRKLAQEFHPDANPMDPQAEERFKQMSVAYDLLKDPAKRKKYDRDRMTARSGWIPSSRAGRKAGKSSRSDGFHADYFRDKPFSDGWRGSSSRRRGPKRGDDISVVLHLTLEDALRGVTSQVTVPADVPCDRCEGSGAERGTTIKPCSHCGGKGTISDPHEYFALSRPCMRCNGTGQHIERPCRVCRTAGVVRKTRRIKVAIPLGVKDATKVRVKGRGEPGSYGGAAGDLIVDVQIAPHEVFNRTGDNLQVVVQVPFETMVLGGSIVAPIIDGVVTLRVPAGTPSGRVLKVRGYGAPSENGKNRGDLLVTLDIEIPKNLSMEAVQALRRYVDLRGATPSAGSRFPADETVGGTS